MASLKTRVETGLSVADLIPSFTRHLRATNKAQATIDTYTSGVDLLNLFLQEKGMPRAVSGLRREHIEAFIAQLLERWKPNTAANRFSALQQFFKWAVEEGELKTSPMDRMKKPRVHQTPPAVLTDDQISALLKTCASNSFEDRRDNALIRFLLDTGCRRAEAAGLTRLDPDAAVPVPGVNLDEGWAIVLGKGSRVRTVAFGSRTARALDRYMRSRSSHRMAFRPELWLGLRGPLTGNGIYHQTIKRRARQAGINAFTHQLRHTFSDRWLSANGAETDLMTLGGWNSQVMLRRYGAARATERAIKAHRSRSFGDRF